MKLIKIIIFFFITFNASLKANSYDDMHSILKEGKKLIFIRHAYAPGVGDPENFDIMNCDTQRNLDKEGVAQSMNIGKILLRNNLEPYKVISSEWCRCKETAEYAFKNYETRRFLNSFFSKKFAHNKSKQIKELKDYIQKWDGKKNLVFVTHYVVILEILNIPITEGEIIVTDKKLNILVRKKLTKIKLY